MSGAFDGYGSASSYGFMRSPVFNLCVAGNKGSGPFFQTCKSKELKNYIVACLATEHRCYRY